MRVKAPTFFLKHENDESDVSPLESSRQKKRHRGLNFGSTFAAIEAESFSTEASFDPHKRTPSMSSECKKKKIYIYINSHFNDLFLVGSDNDDLEYKEISVI